MVTILRQRRDTPVEFTDEEHREVKESLNQSLKTVLRQWNLDVIPLPSTTLRKEPQQILLDEILKELLGGVLDPAKVQKYQQRKQRIATRLVRCYAQNLAREIKKFEESHSYYQWKCNSRDPTVSWATVDLLEYGKRFSYPSAEIDALVTELDQRWRWSGGGTGNLKYEVTYLAAKIIISGIMYTTKYKYSAIGPPRQVMTDIFPTIERFYYPRDRERERSSDPFLAVLTSDGTCRRIIAAWDEDLKGITPERYFGDVVNNKKGRGPIIPDPNDSTRPEGDFSFWTHSNGTDWKLWENRFTR